MKSVKPLKTLAQPEVRRGFSLLELMIVLAIMVLLAGLVLQRLLGQQKKADVQATQSQIAGFKSSLEFFATDLRSFPSTEEGLKALVSVPEDEARARKWSGPYMEELPVDPWGNEYNYEYPPTNGSKDFPNIWSNGPDGESGTEDDIKNWTSDESSEESGSGGSGDDFEL